MLDTWILGVIRTWTPLAVGALLTYLLKNWGIVISEDASAGATLFLGALLTGIYYAVVHALEANFPAIGKWLLALGFTSRKPTYVTPRR